MTARPIRYRPEQYPLKYRPLGYGATVSEPEPPAPAEPRSRRRWVWAVLAIAVFTLGGHLAIADRHGAPVAQAPTDVVPGKSCDTTQDPQAGEEPVPEPGVPGTEDGEGGTGVQQSDSLRRRL